MQKNFLIKERISVPSTINNLYKIRAFVRKQLNETGISRLLREQIVLAVDEASANAIIHGNASNEKELLEIELEIKNDRLVVNICDAGHGELNPEAYLNKKIEKLVKDKKRGGMGLKLIYAAMDHVKYYMEGKKHICCMTKRLS